MYNQESYEYDDYIDAIDIDRFIDEQYDMEGFDLDSWIDEQLDFMREDQADDDTF